MSVGRSVASRRRRYWVCSQCGSPRLEGLWDGYTEANLDPRAKHLRMGRTLDVTEHNPDGPPMASTLQCHNCGEAEAVYELMTFEEFDGRCIEAGLPGAEAIL